MSDLNLFQVAAKLILSFLKSSINRNALDKNNDGGIKNRSYLCKATDEKWRGESERALEKAREKVRKRARERAPKLHRQLLRWTDQVLSSQLSRMPSKLLLPLRCLSH